MVVLEIRFLSMKRVMRIPVEIAVSRSFVVNFKEISDNALVM